MEEGRTGHGVLPWLARKRVIRGALFFSCREENKGKGRKERGGSGFVVRDEVKEGVGPFAESTPNITLIASDFDDRHQSDKTSSMKLDTIWFSQTRLATSENFCLFRSYRMAIILIQ